jgi:hypothetical protein
MSLWSFQGAHETSPSYTETPAESAGLSKLSSVRKTNVEVDVLLGELNSRTDHAVKAVSIERVQRLPE